MSRAQLKQALPAGKSIIKNEWPAAMSLTFSGEPGPGEASMMRQLFIRFDGTDRVAELRACYGDGADAGKGNWKAALLKTLKKLGGAPREVPPFWAAVWRDLPRERPAPVCYEWQDDITLLTYQRDGAGVEVVIRDCPQAHANGVPLPPLQYLPRGPASCLLGVPRETLLHNWGITKPTTTEDGAVVLRPDPTAPYDLLLVWFDKDRAIRIAARHRREGKPMTNPAQWGQAVAEAWARDLRTLGWPRRQELTAHGALLGLGWHDDLTRVRIFWQENDQGSAHAFTEWKDLH
jgi:hypothetical protein